MWTKIDDRAIRYVYMCTKCGNKTHYDSLNFTNIVSKRSIYCKECKRYKKYDHTEIDLDTYPASGK